MRYGRHFFNASFLSRLGLAVLLRRMQGVELRMCAKMVVFLVLLLLVACAGQTASPDGAVESAEDLGPTGDPIEDVAAEFRGMRSVRGHFDGGDWNDDVDKWMGRKHQLMIRLGAHLGSGAYSKATIVRLLGIPDQTARPGDDLFELVDTLPEFERPATGPYAFLIYYWRGTHDFFYFAYQDEAIFNSGWWYAGE